MLNTEKNIGERWSSSIYTKEEHSTMLNERKCSFADYITLLASSKEELEKTLKQILKENCNMKISKENTKVLICSRKECKTRIRINTGEKDLELQEFYR